MQADRDGRAQEFAEKFSGSPLCLKNEKEMETQLERRGPLSKRMEKELGARRDTSTSVFWGWFIIMKVAPHPAVV